MSALQITSVPVNGITKTATFRSLTIAQQADGTFYIDGQYDVILQDSAGNQLGVTQAVRFGFTHAEILANPNFPVAYGALRDLARRGLQQSMPELVTA